MSHLFQWDGESMVPLRPKLADAEFVVGQRYLLEEVQSRSMASHSHQFAIISEAWRNLPEGISDQFPTPEHLRKRALVDAGFYDETIIDAGSNAAALRVAAHLRHKDGFAVVVVRGPMVIERVAKSQSRRAMTPKEFQDSKTKLMEIVSALIGVSPDELTRAAGRAA